MSTTHGTNSDLYRFSVEQYRRMFELGILSEDDKVELLEGFLVTKFPRNPPHCATVHLLMKILFDCLPENQWDFRILSSLVLSDSLPEPDIAIVRGNHVTYSRRHPDAADVGMIIEVADESLERDQGVKARIYARSAIPVYWVVNLITNKVEVYSQPVRNLGSYSHLEVYEMGDSIRLTLDGTTVATLAIRDFVLRAHIGPTQ